MDFIRTRYSEKQIVKYPMKLIEPEMYTDEGEIEKTEAWQVISSRGFKDVEEYMNTLK